jgi:hypothetical protein
MASSVGKTFATPEFRQFFKTLARRLRNETDLSDVTYSALQVIDEFKKDFVRYFFHFNTDKDISVIREFPMPSGDGQPDFVFSAESWDLIVENKIWDENYHFDQYGTTPLGAGRPLPHVGLIANHRVSGMPRNWKFREWTEFVDDFSTKDYGPFRAVFDAYLTYVREICNVAEFKKFTLDSKSLLGLTHFVRTAERALRNISSTSYEVTVKPTHKWSFGESWAGHWFELKPTKPKDVLNLFFGIDFSEEHKVPAIAIDVHSHENPIYFKVIERAPMESPSFNKVLWKEDDMIQLRMPPKEFDSLNADSSKENQLSRLRLFLNACCDAILNTVQIAK